MPSFQSLGVPADLVDALDARGITDAFPVQSATIPDGLAGRDVSGRAPTGSGKTLAFGIPVVARVKRAGPKKPKALILLPTRELAAQVARDLSELGMERGVRVHAFYGGVGFEGQLKALRRGVDVAVACPGRLADLVNQRHVRLDGVEIVVVDEADRMADMGFLPEVKRLLDQANPERQTLLFSATLDGDVDVLVKRYQRNPVRHDVVPPENDSTRVDHHFWTVDKAERARLVADIVRRAGQTIVFTRTRHGADRLAQQLSKQGVDAAAIHGNRSQRQRDNALEAFTRGRVQALVATDVAARGIHVDNVACVVHHDLPAEAKDYVHRSGRTGRAEADGTVVALVLSDQHKLAGQIKRALDLDVVLSPPEPDVVGGLPAVERRAGKTPEATGGYSGGGLGDRDNSRPARKVGPSGEERRPPSRRRKPRPESRSDAGGEGARPRRGPKPGAPSGARPGGGSGRPAGAGSARPGGSGGAARTGGGGGRPGGGSHNNNRGGAPAGSRGRGGGRSGGGSRTSR